VKRRAWETEAWWFHLWSVALDKAIERAHDTGLRFSVVRRGTGWLVEETSAASVLSRVAG
jgi:hypothetical protein